MSKLFKELNYDTDRVMQPGDGDSIAYATCSTASGTAAKVATVQGKTGFTLSQGATVCVKFTAASTDDVPTLNVDSTGAKPIYYNGSAVSATSPFRWSANTVVTFVYDGTAWNAVGVQTNYYATCATAAATQEKTVVVEGGVGFVMTAGTKITVRFTESSTYVGQITANVNGTGALAVRLNRATVNSTTNPLFLTTGSTVTFGLYAGSTLYWEVLDHKRTEYAPCSTAANTAAKTVTAIARGIVLAQGSRFVVRFTYGNTVASPTLTLPGLSAYPICDSKGNALSADGIENWEADDIVVFVFLYNAGKSAFQYQIENSYMAKKLASSIPAAQVSSDWNATSGVAKILNKPTLGTAASKNVGTGSSDVAAGNHAHSDYVSKSITTDQAMSSSLTFPAGKTVEIGSFGSASTYVASMYASSDESYVACGTGTQYTWIDKEGIKHTTDGENTVSMLLFPAASSTPKTIATTDEANLIKLLNLYVDATTPTTSFEMDSSVGWYRGCIGSDGVLPTLDWSNFSMPADSVYQCTLALMVNSSATTLTGPADISWVAGAGLPTSSFAGHWIFISLIREGWGNSFTQAAVWRVL